MKKEVYLSDISGKECTDHVQLVIRRKDHGVKIGNNTIFGDCVLDVDASELPVVLKEATFVKAKGLSLEVPKVSSTEVIGAFLVNPKGRVNE